MTTASHLPCPECDGDGCPDCAHAGTVPVPTATASHTLGRLTVTLSDRPESYTLPELVTLPDLTAADGTPDRDAIGDLAIELAADGFGFGPDDMGCEVANAISTALARLVRP